MNDIPFAAILSISLPGMKQAASTQIVLTPASAIETEGRRKLLRDCTLADIRAFAGQLEAEIWATYQGIRLIDLAEAQDSQIEVTVRGEQGKPVTMTNWGQQAILLPSRDLAKAEEEPETPSDAFETSTPPTESALAPAHGEGTGTRRAMPVEEPQPIPIADVEGEPEPDEALSQVMVLESEPVYAEREATDDPNAYPTPAIAPSQARVRIAGRRRPIGQGSPAAVDILMDESALRATQAHALSSLKREVAGVLLGPRPEKQPDGRYVVHVIDSVIAKHTLMHGASVTYTPESWRYVNDSLVERYPDETVVIVGWYHTHPGFGIFLSGMDQFIHQNFFTQIWHTAFVLDPIARKSGFFCWDMGKTRVSRYEFFWPNWAKESW